MTDVSHIWGNDIQFAADGSLLLATGSEEGRQRVLRRLLTGAGEYLWNKVYGAGLPGKIGLTPTIAELQGIVLSQMMLEAAVSPDPPPTVGVEAINGGLQGYSIDVGYTDSLTGDPVFLGFDVGGGS